MNERNQNAITSFVLHKNKINETQPFYHHNKNAFLQISLLFLYKSFLLTMQKILIM